MYKPSFDRAASVLFRIVGVFPISVQPLFPAGIGPYPSFCLRRVLCFGILSLPSSPSLWAAREGNGGRFCTGQRKDPIQIIQLWTNFFCKMIRLFWMVLTFTQVIPCRARAPVLENLFFQLTYCDTLIPISWCGIWGDRTCDRKFLLMFSSNLCFLLISNLKGFCVQNWLNLAAFCILHKVSILRTF